MIFKIEICLPPSNTCKVKNQESFMTIDVKLTQDGKGWHLDFENGDIAKTDGLDTAILMSVFSEKRASSSEVSKPDLRRGHFINEFSRVLNYQIGSLFWLYTSQSILSDSVIRKLEIAITNGLSWMITDGMYSKTNVSVKKVSGGLEIDIELINKLHENSKYFNLFVAT